MTEKDDLISREALKKALNEIFETVEVVTFDDIIAIIDNASTVELATNLQLTCNNLQQRQGEWLFTEIDENYHIYGQCSVCKERNRIGKFCRSCGAEMRKKV